ncbi:MAG: nitrous oxide reductase accessory protein NosL [Paracoccaceae bacterium]|jgi:nitrous oxide reductase accessory protein NosL
MTGLRLAILALALAALTAGCGRKGDPAPPTPEAARAQTEVKAREGL